MRTGQVNHRGTEDTEKEQEYRCRSNRKSSSVFPLMGLKRGLLINLKVERLVDGVRRVSL
jgi:hypothetical protein